MVNHLFKTCVLFSVLFWVSFVQSQNITVDANTYTPQQLVESILIDSGCIDNVQITNAVGGGFQDSDKSYGYFNANGSDFPFEKGVVLSTGKLANVPGPNTTLSDDDAPGWIGDPDLEAALGIHNTTNATIIEFDFVPNADNIRFRYIFAPEEYQQGDPNTCRYSDAFAFLIKPVGGSYNNIALVPGTNTPVQVTTVHSGISGSCPPINETYFEGWNGPNAPINFNGQTKVLIAESPVIINQAYHIKLVIADEGNHRYDSAVFLEGGSFNIAANLGPDRSFVTNNPLCEDEIYILDATPVGNNPVGYKWFRNDVLLTGETSAELTVTTEGVYKVEIDFGNNCIAIDEVLIEYDGPVAAQNTDLYQCDFVNNGRSTFNLFNAEAAVIDGNPLLRVYSFHRSFANAEANFDPIPNPRSYTNTQPDEVVFARVVSDYGCVGVAEVTLKVTTNTVSPFQLVACSNEGTPGYATFNLSEVSSELIALFGSNSNVKYYRSYADAIAQRNQLSVPFVNTQAGIQTIFARISGNEGCLGTAEVNLRVINTPEFEGPDTFTYCVNKFPAEITLSSGLIGTITDTEFLWSTGSTERQIEVNEAGTYTVTVTRFRTIDGETYTCTSTRTITVVDSEPLQVSYTLQGEYGNQTLTVSVSGTGDYLYALNDGPFQESNVFENLELGRFLLTVREVDGCQSVTIPVSVVGYPNFFTPNNDGYHDFWQLRGLNGNNMQLKQVLIFDRFGKFLHSLDLEGIGWDGTYNGEELPSSDYWFRAIFMDGSVYKGHFTLKR